MFSESPQVAVEQLRVMLLETVDLVEERYPQLDAELLAWARHGVAQGEAERICRADQG